MDAELENYRKTVVTIVANAFNELVNTPGITEDKVHLVLVAEKTEGWKALAFVNEESRMNYFEVHRNDETKTFRVIHFPQWTEFETTD